VLLMKPEEITAWANEVRFNTDDAFQLNNWIPDPPPDHLICLLDQKKSIAARWACWDASYWSEEDQS
jgi:hypothetical protein